MLFVFSKRYHRPNEDFGRPNEKCFETMPLPNKDFGIPNQPLRMSFRSTFQGREYSIWATKRRKLFRTHIRILNFGKVGLES
jgi:hypothetical protein